jgi:hypothetical protein
MKDHFGPSWEKLEVTIILTFRTYNYIWGDELKYIFCI